MRLEPDAHNNMVVRRMFANAYGWPVIKHLTDTHFADTFEARTSDQIEAGIEQSKEDYDGSNRLKHLERSDSEQKEAADHLSPLSASKGKNNMVSANFIHPPRQKTFREDSSWSDHYFEVTDDEDDVESPVTASKGGFLSSSSRQGTEDWTDSKKGTSKAEIADFLTVEPSSAAPLPHEEGLNKQSNRK